MQVQNKQSNAKQAIKCKTSNASIKQAIKCKSKSINADARVNFKCECKNSSKYATQEIAKSKGQ